MYLRTSINKDNFKYRIFYIVFYFLSWGLILLNGGIYWDDWTVVNVSSEAIASQHVSNGYALNAFFMQILFSLTQNIFVFRIYCFLIYLCMVYLLDDILRTVKAIEEFDRFFIVILFAVLPINYARISVAMTFIFNTSFFLFVVAFWILTKYFETNRLTLRIASLVLFLMSFFTPSLILFYLTTMLYIVYVEKNNIKNVSSFFNRMLHYMDFILAPIIFAILRSLYFGSHGLYAGYNTITASGVAKAPIQTWIDGKAFLYQLSSIFSGSFVDYHIELLIMAFILFLSLLHLSRCYRSGEHSKADVVLFGVGIFMLLLAIIPYAVIGNKHPHYCDWNSRHQLLYGVGLSFAIYYGVVSFVRYLDINKRIMIFILSLIIVMCVHANLYVQLEYCRDWLKQLSVMENFRQSDIIRNNTSFFVVDNAPDLNARSRVYRFYEFSGMMKKIFSDETRFASVEPNHWNELGDYFIPYSQYSIRHYNPKPYQYKVEIIPGDCNLKNTFYLFKLIYMRFCDRDEFEKRIKTVVHVNYEKLI